MNRIDLVEVWHTDPKGHRQHMGQLARNSRGAIGFSMDTGFLEAGWRLSPFFRQDVAWTRLPIDSFMKWGGSSFV